MGSVTNQIKAEVTDRVIEALEAGTVPWKRPWSGDGIHRNHASGRPYRGVNQWLLDLAQMSGGFGSSRWLTYRQAKAESDKLGGEYCGVRKGEQGAAVVFWKFLTVEEEIDGERFEKKIPMLKSFRVFNVEQTDLPVEVDPVRAVEPDVEAERIINEMPNRPTISFGGSSAFYRPLTDSVHMPSRDSFHSIEGYYGTLFHELVHSTGHVSRLNRPEVADGSHGFGGEPYAREELVAELGSAILSRVAGVQPDPSDVEQEAAYIGSWLKALRNDTGLLIAASSRAQKAADFILGESA